MTILYGKTYAHKEEIKALGFRWKSESKTWQKQSVTEQELQKLIMLPGLFIDNGNEKIDTRSHKEKYGQCEDAPCCGCCGQQNNYYPF